MKNYTFTDILNDEHGRAIVEQIEEAEEEIRGRGIDPADMSEFWARARVADIQLLWKKFRFNWELSECGTV